MNMSVRAEPKRESSTRRDIILLLKKNGLMTVQEMSEQLGLTGMAIRRHLIVLQKEQYIQIAFQRRDARKPTSVYRLSSFADRLFPSQYDVLTMELLDGIQDTFGDAFVDTLFALRKKKLESKYQSVMVGQNLEKRITALAQIQDSEGYMVKLERNGEGTYTLEEANCPVSKVAIRYRQICQCELALFSEVLDAHVERTESMADGEAKCRYLVSERSKPGGSERNASGR